MNFLKTIVKEKQDFVAKRKSIVSEEKLIAQFKDALSPSRFKSVLRKPGIHLIAEIKRASPSKGDLRPELDVAQMAKLYEENGVELISILAEEKFFKGSLDDIKTAKKQTELPILCKDFIIDSYQIYEAKLHGADAILLIAALLNNEQISEFIDIARSVQMDSVVEVHSEEELKRVLELGSELDILGINHRNLGDFSVDTTLTEKLTPHFNADQLVIAESGIESAQQIKKFDELGMDGVLIGESLMREKDIAGKLKEFTAIIEELNKS